MKAKILYSIEHLSWGDSDERSGWYIVRKTVSTPSDGKRGSVIDTFPVAKFMRGPNGLGTIDEMMNFDDFVKDGGRILPRNTNHDEFWKAVGVK